SVTIDKLFDPDLPEVYADSNQIWQVFVNMLINSLEYMNSNGHLIIKTGVNRDFNELNKRIDYVYIIFQDNGQGIKDESIEKIFDPFFTTKASGTGLGLSVGYKIINSHNGRMMVNSQYGKGTKFMVEIPIDSTNIRKVSLNG
ncbi:MAG: ATP-binding protein, partial [Thermodesulfobacteriota bacterium]